MVFSENSSIFVPSHIPLFAVGPLLSLYKYLTIGLLGVSLVIGQVIRVPILGQAGGLLVSDIAVVLLVGVAFLGAAREYARGGLRAGKASYWLLLTAPFLIWSLGSLVINASHLSHKELLIAASYWVRLSLYLLVAPALLWCFRTASVRKRAEYLFLVVVTGVIGLGVMQFVFLPQLSALPAFLRAGWDPHEFRLVSTWLDPNFLGLFLVLSLCWLAVTPVLSGYWRIAWLAISMSTLVLTQSRSSIMALVVAVIVVSPFLLWRGLVRIHGAQALRPLLVQLIAGACMLLAVAGVGSYVLRERLLGAAIIDTTAQLRVTALQQAWQVFGEKTAFVGVGYNAYQFAAVREGLQADFSLHSRAGTDSSLLTLWITTGIPGAVLFLVPWVYGARVSLQAFIRKNHMLVLLLPLTCLLAVLVHSLFVNSFLYAHILISLSFLWALSLSTDAA